MSKSDYRALFLCFSEYVKMGKIAEECNIQKTRLSSFMHGYDYALSLEKLDMLLASIKAILRDLSEIE